MTQQDKDLLLRDLSARFPYNVIIRVPSKESTFDKRLQFSDIEYYFNRFDDEEKDIPKPYLRPMSSMTEYEKKKYNDIVKNTIDFYDSPKSDKVCFFILPIDWLNSHHFDYRGLIEKGLALEAKEGMYEKK